MIDLLYKYWSDGLKLSELNITVYKLGMGFQNNGRRPSGVSYLFVHSHFLYHVILDDN